MEDNVPFLAWWEDVNSEDGLDLSGLLGKPCPEGGLKTGVFLHEDQKRMLAILRQEVEHAKKMWNAHTALTAGDTKVAPFQELCVQCYRCHLLSGGLWMSVRALVPTEFYVFVGVGFDSNFEIWVGPGLKRDLQDVRHVFDLYPQRP